MDHLKEGIGLRAVGQRDPLIEYKREAFDIFEEMVIRVRSTVLEYLFKVQLVREPAEEPSVGPAWPARSHTPVQELRSSHATERPAESRRAGQKVGRNDPCPCGSGKKYKRCCIPKFG